MVDNTVKFLIKSVSVDEFTTVSEINKKIENFPFFILPNFGGDSFSFVYTDPNSVPDSVRNFLLLQDSETLKLIGTQPLSLLFETHNLRYYEQHNLNKFNEQLSAILQNISGN